MRLVDVKADGTPTNDPGAPASDRTAFLAAYDRLLTRWPAPHKWLSIDSAFGTTSVIVSGPPDAPPVVLIHAYQATSAEWIELARALSTDRRVFAVDVNGDAGHSTTGQRTISTTTDMVEWLDAVLDGLQLATAEVCGHSYGAWIALAYAIERPTRVDRVTLLDPTMTFAPLYPHYILRALPALMKPTSARRASLIRWESKKSNAEIVGFVGDIPPDRHEFWPSGHITSLAAGLSCPAMKCGATMMVLSSAPARKPAAVLVSK